MTVHEFIFTLDKPKRYFRHIVFWSTRLVVQILSNIVFFNGCFWECLLKETRGRFYLILPEIVFTYTIVYYVIPNFLEKKKYLKFSTFILVLTALCYWLFCLFLFKSRNFFTLPANEQVMTLWHFSMSFITEGPPIGCMLFLAIKMLKTNFRKLEEKELLSEENNAAELQLLKAQVHPHFLFNTLNNIYSFTLSKSDQAGILIKKLTSVFRYMTNECEQPLVPLDKELKILQDYIGLEKVRYGNRLSIDINIKGDPANKMISPLLMIPFVENSFKHGTSQMLSESWIQMEINIEDNTLNFLLRNSKPPQNKYSNGKNGIGLENVKKRLQLIYTSDHSLKINADDNIFSVSMSVPIFKKIRTKEIVQNGDDPELFERTVVVV